MDRQPDSVEDSRPRCECCAGGHLDIKFLPDTITHEAEDGPITIEAARIPFRVCDTCGRNFVTGETIRARHDYICEELGFIKPSQIKAIRERRGINQVEFARITDFGVASLSRWERGRSLPSSSINNYLLLMLEHPSILDSLLARKAASSKKAIVCPQMQASTSRRNWHLPDSLLDDRKAQAARFAFV